MITICYIFGVLLLIAGIVFRKLYRFRREREGMDEMANDYFVCSTATLIVSGTLCSIGLILQIADILM